MDKADIQAMPAGKELDEQVAVIVFRRELNVAASSKVYGFKDGLPVPAYSTEIAYAWLIVEAFRRGIYPHPAACVNLHISDVVNQPDCECKIYGPSIATVEAQAEEMPLAICWAALMVRANERKNES